MKIKWKKTIMLGIVFCVFSAVKAHAVIASPEVVKIKQPDGREFLARAFGDEWYNGMETAEGYTIFKEPLSGYWVYAKKTSTGELYPSDLVVGFNLPEGIQKHLRDEVAIQMIPSSRYPRGYPEYRRGKKGVTTLPTLVLLVEFTNQKLSTKISDWKRLFFGSNNSVQDYYKEVSYNQFYPVPYDEDSAGPSDQVYGKNNGIVKVRLDMEHPNTRSNIGDENRTIVREALIAVDKYIDFSKYDTNTNGAISRDEAIFVFICAGYEASYGGFNAEQPNVWGHRWSLKKSVPAPTLDGVSVANYYQDGGYTQIGERHARLGDTSRSAQAVGHMATIGILAHEIGHDGMGWPDTYDTDGSSNGVGKWDLMASGSWNSLKFSGDSPSHPNPFFKYETGWTNPKKLPQPLRQSGKLTKYNIEQCETTKENAFYLLGTNPNGPEIGGKGEYFLIENRQKVGYDKGLRGSGLLIWHIEESRTNNKNEQGTEKGHYLIALEQADGKRDLENDKNKGDRGDPFPGAKKKNTRFAGKTKPNSNFYGGKSSKVRVINISKSHEIMTAKLSSK